jgi:hypothetical protein
VWILPLAWPVQPVVAGSTPSFAEMMQRVQEMAPAHGRHSLRQIQEEERACTEEEQLKAAKAEKAAKADTYVCPLNLPAYQPNAMLTAAAACQHEHGLSVVTIIPSAAATRVTTVSNTQDDPIPRVVTSCRSTEQSS